MFDAEPINVRFHDEVFHERSRSHAIPGKKNAVARNRPAIATMSIRVKLISMGAGFAGRHSPANGKGFATRLPSSLACESLLTGGHPCALLAEFSLFDSGLAVTTAVTMVVLLVQVAPRERSSADTMKADLHCVDANAGCM
jgi:hypothetical protein